MLLAAAGAGWTVPWAPADAAALRAYSAGANAFLLDTSASGLTSFTAGLDGFSGEPLRASYEHIGGVSAEAFNVRVTSSGRGMDDLSVRWEGEAFTGYSRSPGAWTSPGIFTDRGALQSVEEFTGEGFYEAFFTFSGDAVGAPRVALFDFVVFAFSPLGSHFDIVIRVNGGEPQADGVAHTPLPGGLWLLASAVLAVAAARRRSRSRGAPAGRRSRV